MNHKTFANLKIVYIVTIMWSFLSMRCTLAFVSRSYSKPLSRTLSKISTLKSNQSDDSSDESIVNVPRKFKPFPFQYQEELDLTVSGLTNRGIGVCRVSIETPKEEMTNNGDGNEKIKEEISNIKGKWVVMVPNVIPGERIRAKVYRNFNSYSEADLVEIIEASPNRVKPSCPLFEECGGCQYQHMDIDTQRKWKTSQVQDLLQRIGKFDPTSFPETRPTVGTDETYHYRSKITPHYDRPVKTSSSVGDMEIRAIGFQKKTNRNLIDVEYCHIATETINSKLVQLRKEIFDKARDGKLEKSNKGATLLLRDALKYDENNPSSEEKVVETDNNVYVKTMVKDLTFKFVAGNFFQNNPFMLPVMVDHVVQAAIEPNPKGERMTHLIDCYCGSGLFCLSASKEFDVCVGIEVNEKAVEEATENANLNNILNCKFVAASAEAIFMSNDPVELESTTTYVKDFPKDKTVVVIDPPRKGCSEEFLEQLYTYAPQRVVYMSCDPATQARDAEGIVRAGYTILSVQPFDLFPQTRHIESLIVFEKKAI